MLNFRLLTFLEKKQTKKTQFNYKIVYSLKKH